MPENVVRERPAGHARAVPGNVSGRMTVTWTLLTPLLLPSGHGPAVGRVVVPGSAVKGALRSLHETLVGGCLRILDDEFVPVYRQPAAAKDERWSLGVVRASTRDGRATEIEMATRTVWVPIEAVRGALGRVPQTGDRIGIEEWAIQAGLLGRMEADGGGVRGNGSWTVLVGDAGARQNSKKFFVAAGLLEGDKGELLPVPEGVWDDYAGLCEGTDDMRRIRAAAGRRQPSDDVKGWRTERLFKDVMWQRRTVGRRRQVTGRLWPGDVVWVRREDGVAALSMAAIWREHGEFPMGDRVPFSACYDPDLGGDGDSPDDGKGLCPSCRLFGSADTRGSVPGEEAEQHSYAGHLRVGDAVAHKVTTEQIDRLAPMGAPRPGAGQFYLKMSDVSAASNESELPSASWGSEHDGTPPRRVRGRKFYWHGDPAAQEQPRHIARPEQKNEAMSGARHVVPAGTTFTQRIAFDNVSLTELCSLLMTLLPETVFRKVEKQPDAKYALRLGGGKPLGLGSCTAEVSDLHWWVPADRYTGVAETRASAEQFVDEFLGSVYRSVGRQAAQYWPVLGRVLRQDGVDAQLIWYPQGGPGKNLDRSFMFFKDTNGRFLKNPKKIVPLPDPADPADDQTIRFGGS
ncbi:hypothetical protein [Actinocorallia lasiicapitis]